MLLGPRGPGAGEAEAAEKARSRWGPMGVKRSSRGARRIVRRSQAEVGGCARCAA